MPSVYLLLDFYLMDVVRYLAWLQADIQQGVRKVRTLNTRERVGVSYGTHRAIIPDHILEATPRPRTSPRRSRPTPICRSYRESPWVARCR